jgi:uroporphyrinogen-III decarboxylase
MAADVEALLDRVCGLVAARIDPERIAAAQRRQADAFAWRAGDSLPILFGRAVPEAADLPDFDWARRFHDPAASLYMQLKDDVLPQVAAGGDCVPAVRANLGVINGMTVFGAAYAVPAHTMPVITRYVAKETLAAFEVPEDVGRLGTMPRVVEHMEHHRAALEARGLGAHVRLLHCDQQGPFDIAAQARGHDLFTDLYDDPPFVHGLMRKCTQVYVAVSRLCKRIDPAPLAGGAGSALWMANGSVRMCGDSDILISAAQHREFVAPYEQDAFQAMGGGWLHYCGGVPGFARREGLHLHEVYAGIEGLRGLNWTTAGDWMGEMRRLRALGLVHVGTLPRGPGETLEDYFRRVLEPYPERAGLVLDGHDVRPEEADRAVDAWRRVQDDVYGRGGAGGT